MSREIKYRVWGKAEKEYIRYPFSWLSIFDSPDGLEIEENEDLIIEQYTGLKDKNGKEIYEGDIMRYDAIDYKVLWADYYAGFETKRLNSPWNNAGLTLHFLASVGRVTGNIHENPELLGGEDA